MGTALVTGATSGLGREFCWQLAAAKHNLVVVARNESRLEELAEELRQVAAIKVQVLRADLAEPEDLARVCQRLEQNEPEIGGPVGLLVNNAGFGLGKRFLNDTLDRELYGLEVMVRAVMVTSHFAGRAMVDRGHGAILNVSSVAADTGMGTYSAHKAWVRAFSEGLAEELHGTGVTCTVVCPGLVQTEFHERMGTDMSEVPDFAWAPADQVVSQALDAVRRGQVIVTPTALYKVVNGAARMAPRGVVRAVTRLLPHT